LDACDLVVRPVILLRPRLTPGLPNHATYQAIKNPA
jgi:hypothetical protein